MDKNDMEQLLNEVQTISESYKRVADATGENFNLFSILQVESDEVTTHSRFIAELLNPKGRHGQKDIFLKRFKDIFNINDFNTETAKVYVEYVISPISADFKSGGRIDILVKSGENAVFMIENKIYAEEQPHQLSRYKKPFHDSKLFYLTLFGSESAEKGIVDYEKISYSDDIINWLEECKRDAVDIPILRETISQYINLVKKLTHQNLNKKMSQDIVSRILRDENSFSAYTNLYNSKNELIKNILNDKLFNALENIAKEYNLKLHLEKNILLDYSKKWKGFYFFNDKLEELNLKIYFEFNIACGYQKLIFGIFKLSNDKQKIDLRKLENVFQQIFGSCNANESYRCYCSYQNYSNWEDLNTLQRIIFNNEFERDLNQKVSQMLKIVEQTNWAQL